MSLSQGLYQKQLQKLSPQQIQLMKKVAAGTYRSIRRTY